MSLIVFFNGWGMDEKILPDIEEKHEILCINFPYSVPLEKLEGIEEIIFIGWSFGAYYANKFLKENPRFQNSLSIAINGTPDMIGKNGIPKKILELTLKTLSEDSLRQFHINMECNNNLFAGKDITFLRDELKYFIENSDSSENFFKGALISVRDRIVPAKNQENYFSDKNVIIKKISYGHFIFHEMRGLSKIVEMFKSEI